MQAWCLDIPFLIFLIIVTCLDKPKILFMLDYKKIHYCTIILNLPLNKTTKKQRCMKLKSPSFQRCRITQKERSLILVAKGLQQTVLYKFTRRKLGRPARSFFCNEPTKFEKTIFWTALVTNLCFACTSKSAEHGCLLLITLFIWSELCLTFE